MAIQRFSPVGLSITAGVARAVQLQRKGDGWAVRDAVAIPLDTQQGDIYEVAADRLAEVWCRRRFVGREVIMALPNADLIAGLVEVEAEPGDALLPAALETERVHGLSAGTYELTAWEPEQEDVSRRVAVMVQACTHEAARRWCGALAHVGLTVTRIDSRASAMVPLVANGGTEDKTHAVLDVGRDASSLVLLRGGVVIYQRALPDAGLSHAIKVLKDAGLDDELAQHALHEIGLAGEHQGVGSTSRPLVEKSVSVFIKRLLREAEPALDYAARVYAPRSIDSVTVVGEGADVPGLQDEIASRLSLASMAARRADVIGLSGHGEYAAALGLCLCELQSPDTQINLLPMSVLESREKQRNVRWGVSAAVAYAAVLMFATLVYLGINHAPDAAVASTAQLVSAQEKTTKLEQALAQVRDEIDEANRRLEGSRVLSERPDWSTVLRLVSQSTGQEVVLDDLRVSMTGVSMGNSAKVLIKGAAKDPWALSTFVLSLEQLGLFDRVSIERSQRAPRSAVTVTEFNLTCTIGDQAQGDGR